jgi:hypothetical protein
MHRRNIVFGAFVAAATFASGLGAQGGTLARSYLVTPRTGTSVQFEAALAAHAAVRREATDPWSWTVYVVETGADAGSFLIRSGNHEWADFDRYEAAMPFQEQVGEHWNNTVAPLVGAWSSMITATDTSLSWNPQGMTGAPAFVKLTGFKLRPGMERRFMTVVREAHAALAAGQWAQPYTWSYPVSGHDDGPLVWLVTFHADWADMADPEPGFDAVMVQQLGEAEYARLMEDMGSAMRGTESMTMRFRPDLSVLR